MVHTYHVVDNAIMISKKLGLSEEDINLAALIGILHDIGRFDELKNLKKFDSVGNDHAMFASKLLFEEGLITKFIDTDKYNNIIKKAIENQVKQEEPIENIFPGIVNNKENLENSLISDNVYNSVMKEECVDIKDRKYPLDYWICVLAFTFDLYFKETLLIVKENNYINILIDRFQYNVSSEKMNEIRKVLNEYIEKRLNE